MKLSVSIGIMAFNEDRNIKKLLDSILSQKTHAVSIFEVIIISSGSTDDTNSIIKQYAKSNPKIKTVIEKSRKGKASAVNKFIRMAKKNILVLVSADIIPKKDSLENLVVPLKNPSVGIVGAHPIPLNNKKSFMGFAAHLLWNLHHQISLKTPKMGEVIAFRKIFQQIPIVSSVDEANIEPLIRGQGYQAIYAYNAIVYNKGPEVLHEFIAGRRRIYFGHLSTKHEYSYEVSTYNPLHILFILLRSIEWSWRFFLWTPFVISLEAYSRFLGLLDYKFNLKSHTIWEITPSTKSLKKKP